MITMFSRKVLSHKALAPAALFALAITPALSHAWSGDTWGSETRSTMESIATKMMVNTWTPKNTMYNFGYGSTYRYFYKGTTYTGTAYSQNNPQESWSEFLNAVNNTAGGTTGFGNDCSGFASMAWKLPSRYTTWTFENDASNSGGYVSSLGAVGSGPNVSLKLGDALNASSYHIILFKKYVSGGVMSMEQTPWTARSREWSWSQLNSYRPIRRNNISEVTTPSYATGTVNTSGSSLNVRSGPSTSYAVVDTVADGAKVTIYCQTTGQTISGTYGTTNVWDRIGTGKYVSDAYVYTGSDGRVAPACQ